MSHVTRHFLDRSGVSSAFTEIEQIETQFGLAMRANPSLIAKVNIGLGSSQLKIRPHSSQGFFSC